jgi:hypothetical protein
MYTCIELTIVFEKSEQNVITTRLRRHHHRSFLSYRINVIIKDRNRSRNFGVSVLDAQCIQ